MDFLRSWLTISLTSALKLEFKNKVLTMVFLQPCNNTYTHHLPSHMEQSNAGHASAAPPSHILMIFSISS